MDESVLGLSSIGSEGVLGTAMRTIEMLLGDIEPIDQIERGEQVCQRYTKLGVCGDPAGITGMGSYHFDPLACIFHNLWSRRDALGRFETRKI